MPTHTLKGRLLNKFSGNPIENALVFQNNSTFDGWPSNKQGEFKLEIDKDSKKSINIKAEGYKEANFPFHLNGKLKVFYLEPIESSPEAEETTSEKPANKEAEQGKEEKPAETQSQQVPPLRVIRGNQPKTMQEIIELDEKPKKKGRDWEEIIMIGLLVVLFGAIGYFIYKMYKKGNPTPAPGNPEPISQPPIRKINPTPAPAAPSIKTPQILKVN